MTENHRKATPREVEMIGMRLGGKTLEEIGEHYGITRERVRQLLMRNGIDTTNAVYTLTCEYCRKPFKALGNIAHFCRPECERNYKNDKEREKARSEGVPARDEMLSARKEEALLYIRRTYLKTGESPTVADIARWCKIETNQAAPMLKQMMDRGLLRRIEGQRRALYLTDKALEMLRERGYTGE